MSTFVKVTQEGSELLRRNAEQTQGRRLAKLEADEQRRTEQQAREARQQALLQQGLAPSGDPFDDARRRRFRPDELAASSRPIGNMAHIWIEGGFSYSRQDIGNGLNDGIYSFSASSAPESPPGQIPVTTRYTYTYTLLKNCIVSYDSELIAKRLFVNRGSSQRSVFTSLLTNETTTSRAVGRLILPSVAGSAIVLFYGYKTALTRTFTEDTRYTIQYITDTGAPPPPFTEESFRAAVYNRELPAGFRPITAFSSQNTGDKVYKAFVFNATTAREIAIPGSLLPVLDFLTPLETRSYSQLVQPYDAETYVVYYTETLGPDFPNSVTGSLVDPRAFITLRQYALNNGIASLMPTAESLNLRKYYFKDEDRSVNYSEITGDSGIYSYLVNSVDSPDGAIRYPSLDYTYPASLEKPIDNIHSAVTSAQQDQYCREQLLSLGFSPSDLTP